MAPNPRRQDARLRELYDQVPAIECRGLCSDSCGPIQMSLRERLRIEKAHGTVTCGSGATCSMLDEHRRCRAYDMRPLICRLWGVTESMPCPYGCRPERYLTNYEAAVLVAKADVVGGGDSLGRLASETQAALAALERKHLEDPESTRQLLDEIVEPHRPTIYGRNMPRTIIEPGDDRP